jgi:4-hydroxybenzoate polyprenyltransferase
MLLARVSNLPTVWSNVIAGTALATAPSSIGLWSVVVVVACSCFYVGGMFLNDAFDADVDARDRTDRPIPAGDVSRREAFGVGWLLLAAGWVLLAPDRLAVLWATGLVSAIVLYDYKHKGAPFAPVIMGVCRGLVYVVAGAAAGAVSTSVLLGAAIVAVYVTTLTVVAKLAGREARWLVPVLIAAISLVDALLIATLTSAFALAVVAALGFPSTLLLQRAVPGD